MKTYSADVEAKIVSIATAREMTFSQVASALENYNEKMGRFIPTENVAPYQVELAITYADANEPDLIANSAANLLFRCAATYWARAAGAHVPDAMRFFDSMEKWDAQEFARKYPITLPTNDEGLIDGLALANSDISGTLQRAIMFDLQADIAVTSTQGGDDTWFDYLPNGILQLQSMQAEDWTYIWADIWNTHPFGLSDDDREEYEEADDDVEEKLAEKYGFYIQDVTSGFIYYFMRPHTR
jgi:hypothetical protein